MIGCNRKVDPTGLMLADIGLTMTGCIPSDFGELRRWMHDLMMRSINKDFMHEHERGYAQGKSKGKKSKQKQQKTQIVKIKDDQAINKKLDEIRKNAKPLAPGETPVPTTPVHIVGEEIKLQNATVIFPDGSQRQVANGYMRPVALVVLDQGGNIIVDPNMSVQETVKADRNSTDAVMLESQNKLRTSNQDQVLQESNGVFYDAQIRGQGSNILDIRTTQDLIIRTGRKSLFKIEGIQIHANDATKSYAITEGRVRKFH